MSCRRARLIARLAGTLGVALAALLPAAPLATQALARDGGEAGAEGAGQPASELLQDGRDALSDDQRELARQLFELVLRQFPRSREAAEARRELSRLGNSDGNASDSDSADASAAEPEAAPNPAAPPSTAEADANGRDAPGQSAPRAAGITAPRPLPALRTQFVSEAGDRVFFAETSAVIGGRARAMIENQARWLNARATLDVTLIGRADDGVAASEHQALAQRRAEAVRDRLLAAGVDAGRIRIESRGANDPIASCAGPLCQAQNRMVETWLSGFNVITGDVRGEAATSPPRPLPPQANSVR